MTCQSLRILTVVSAAIQFLTVGSTCAQSTPPNRQSGDPDQFAFGFSATFAKNANSYSVFEGVGVDYYYGGCLEYSFAPIVMMSFTDIDDQVRYSFKSPINLVLLGLDALATRHLLGLHTPAAKSPLRYILFAPNSAVNLRLHGKLKFTVATTTEYVFYRLHEGERGILFTPQIGFTLSGGRDTPNLRGVVLTIGASRFWNFDGQDKEFRLAVRIGLMAADIQE